MTEMTRLSKVLSLPCLFFLLMSSVSCDFAENTNLRRENGQPSLANSAKKRKEIKAEVSDESVEWDVDPISLSSPEFVKKSLFVTDKIGFALAADKLFRTTDGGHTWELRSHFTDTYAADIAFSTKDDGILISISKSSLGRGYESQILKTENGGKDWTTITTLKDTIVERVKFHSHGIGAIVGRRNPRGSDANVGNVILLTVDQGDTWTDRSMELNRTATMQSSTEAEFLTDVGFLNETTLRVLSSAGNIYESKELGINWSFAAFSENAEGPETTSRFGQLSNDVFWTLKSTVSVEGKWTALTFDFQQASSMRRLPGFAFADVYFLNDSEIVACGRRIGPDNYGGSNKTDQGVLMYSKDQGMSWSKVLESATVHEFTSINKAASGKLVVSGDNGAILLVIPKNLNIDQGQSISLKED